MVEVASIDFETFSRCDLRKCGSHVYAMDPSTDVMCLCYAIGDGPIQLWVPGQPAPADLVAHVRAGGVLQAWNYMFEKNLWEAVLARRYKFPLPQREQWSCTMARSYAMGFPGSLEKAAIAMKMPFRKDKVGSRIMMQLCQPKRDGSRWTPENAPAKFKVLYDYCAMDVEVERAAGKRLVPLSAMETRIFHMDGRLNDRGVHVHRELVDGAKLIATATKERLVARMKHLTDFEVAGPSAVAELKKWLGAQGVPVGKELRATDVEAFLARDDLPPKACEALTIRREFAKTSVSKLDAFLARMDPIDDRVRGTVQYHGAGTSRWAARGLQTQNFPRPVGKPNIKQLVLDLIEGDPDWIEAMHGAPMTAIANALRAMISAGPGNKLMARDLSQIEARVGAWLAGDDAKLDAFRRYDAKLGPDLYIVGAAGIYNVPASSISKDDLRRQVGKVAELALGFQGGAVALAKMAKAYGIDMATLYPSLMAMSDTKQIRDAVYGWTTRGVASGMSERAFMAAELVKLRWRGANPATVAFWKALEEASVNAVLRPGHTFTAGPHLSFKKTGSFLRVRMPSGRFSWYPFPRVETTMRYDGTPQHKLFAWGVDSVTNSWCEYSLYGGLVCENVVQGCARDVMAEALLRHEDAGYLPVLTIHDEDVCEVPSGFGSEEEFHRLFVQPVEWAPGLPIAGDGWVGNEYRK